MVKEDQTARVFVVDDDDAIRDSISLLLETVDIPTTSFNSATEFLENFDPDAKGCLVLDIRMPKMSGLDLQAHLHEIDCKIPIVFITGHGDIPMAVEAMRSGAINFIRKPFSEQELLDCVNEALDVEANQRVHHEDVQAMRDKIEKLTPRELEVFERVSAGQANKVIAIELGISERTVEIHRGQVMNKTESRSLAELVRLKLLRDQEATA